MVSEKDTCRLLVELAREDFILALLSMVRFLQRTSFTIDEIEQWTVSPAAQQMRQLLARYRDELPPLARQLLALDTRQITELRLRDLAREGLVRICGNRVELTRKFFEEARRLLEELSGEEDA